jgi:hypothetical protein
MGTKHLYLNGKSMAHYLLLWSPFSRLLLLTTPYFIHTLTIRLLLALPYQGKDIVIRFMIEYSSLMDFGPN